MAFDPLAFMKPSKAFSIEGLLSRDMFENFAADDGQFVYGDAEECTYEQYQDTESRLRFLSGCITERIDQIIQWINQWDYINILIASSVIHIVGGTDPDWEVLFEFIIDDGPRLNPAEAHHTLAVIRRELSEQISGVAFTEIEESSVDNGPPIYNFMVYRGAKTG